MKESLLEGLEAQNPLGLFAALGLLRVLDEHARAVSDPRPRLGFVEQGALVACLVGPYAVDEMIEIVLRDAEAQAGSPALQFAYDQEGKWVNSLHPGLVRDLKPSLAGARAFLESIATAPRRVSDLAAAWFTDVVPDNKGNAKPTAFHYTAGQQAFLHMVEKLRVGLTAEHVREALVGPWLNGSELPSLSWDSSGARTYALRATNPSGDPRGSVPGANWLAANGLAFFPVVADHGRLQTTCVRGGWKSSAFSWPVWGPASDAPTIGSLLRQDTSQWTASQRTVAGVIGVFESRILRSDQGGYGSFTPARAVPPRVGSRYT
jgi:hypothetical protein